MSLELKIYDYITNSTGNGPGKRFTIWLQGCIFNCKNCFNKNLKQLDKGNIYKLDDIKKIILNTNGIEGVTYSGGEPFLQAEALSVLSDFLKKKSLTIISYTGYKINDLKYSDDKYKKKLLSQLDILIDGSYNKHQKSKNIWIGSDNQKVHFLTKRYMYLKEKINQPYKDVELIINNNGDIVISGFPDYNFLKKLTK
jgi:anaerobic ribonucleoside-triphosphate reductase activating protein